MTDRVDVVVVSGEPLWPPHHGGRIRGARIVEELGRRFRVLTAAPVQGAVPAGVRVEPLPDELRTSRVFAVASPQPRLGRALLGPRRLAVLREVLVRERPAVVLFASGYLAARVPDAWLPVAVDFVDVDVRRMASLAGSRGATLRSRGSAAVERVKARRWEPEVARRAVLAASPSNDDVELLRSWGAAAVHVPHGADRHDVTPSPVTGPVTFVASFTYAPNVHAARFVLQEVWPPLHRAEPGLRLRLAGRDASRLAAPPSVELVSDPDHMDAVYREASVVLAPVRVGGGSQLKVTEALARGRAVVATPYSARSAPAGGADAVLVADSAERYAGHVLHLWRDVAARHAAEKSLVESRPVPTWEEACAPLLNGLERIVARR